VPSFELLGLVSLARQLSNILVDLVAVLQKIFFITDAPS